MTPEAGDFVAEATALYEVVASQPRTIWGLRTQFKDWSINDVILHLFASDALCLASLESEESYRALKAEIDGLRGRGLSMIEESRRRYPDLQGKPLLDLWIAQARKAADILARRDPRERLVWSGPSMSVRMMAIARQMETWAHGQEVHDRLGLDRLPTRRLKNIAEIGVRTYGWTFANRGLDAPGPPPRVSLQAPEGDTWTWNDTPGTQDRVEGPAVGFCQVVTQVRNVADTDLRVCGSSAGRWMALAQCFAGPPSDPPSPGTRCLHKGPIFNDNGEGPASDHAES